MILLEDFNAHNPLWRSEKMSTRYNLLCLNDKKETYYRANDGCKLTINLTLANLTIVSEYKWIKEYKFKGSEHFPIMGTLTRHWLRQAMKYRFILCK